MKYLITSLDISQKRICSFTGQLTENKTASSLNTELSEKESLTSQLTIQMENAHNH